MTEAANEPSYPICRACETESWCARNGCIPVTDPVDEEVQQAISDLVYQAMSTSNVATRASEQTLRLVATPAHTVQETPL